MTSISKTDTERVFTQQQIWAGAFLAGPLTGCIMLAMNFRVFGKPEKFYPTIVMGVVMVLAVIVMTSHLTIDVPGNVIGVLYAGIFALIAHFWQGEALRAKAAVGMPPVRFLRSLGVVCIGLLCTAVIVVVSLMFDPSFGAMSS